MGHLTAGVTFLTVYSQNAGNNSGDYSKKCSEHFELGLVFGFGSLVLFRVGFPFGFFGFRVGLAFVC